MAFFQLETEQLFHQGAEGDSFVARESPRQFGVEKAYRLQTQFKKTREILSSCVQDPFERIEHFGQYGKLARKRYRVDEKAARTFTPQLNEVRLGPISIAGSTLRVYRNRARSLR